MEGGNKMTREEQIKKQADIYTDDASNYAEWSDDGGWSETNDIALVEKAFIEGAKWADSHNNLSEEEQVGMGGLGMMWQNKYLIDKACEYLRTHLWQSVDADNDPIVESVHNITVDNFIKDFKRYLE